MNIGKEIMTIRKERKMTQEAFGKMFYVTRQTVSNWENEKSYPDLQVLIKISNTFDITLDKLIKEDEDMAIKIDKERRSARVGRFVIVILIVIIIFAGLGVKIYFVDAFKATPDTERNISATAATMYVNLPDSAPSRAIVRTYDKEKYNNFSEQKLREIRKEIGGKIEGDIPVFHLNEEGTIKFVFQKTLGENVIPDNPPKLIIKQYDDVAMLPESDTSYNGNINKWKGKLLQNVEGYYILNDENIKANEEIIRVCMIEVSYSIRGEDYVSVSAFYID